MQPVYAQIVTDAPDHAAKGETLVRLLLPLEPDMGPEDIRRAWPEIESGIQQAMRIARDTTMPLPANPSGLALQFVVPSAFFSNPYRDLWKFLLPQIQLTIIATVKERRNTRVFIPSSLPHVRVNGHG